MPVRSVLSKKSIKFFSAIIGLPLKAIEILDLVGLYTAKTKELKSFANEDEVINTMREITNQSQEELAKNEDKIILNGERLISKDIIGQDWAVHRVANKLKQNELDLKEGKLNYKPISFLFVGATGVGKTELAKSIAKIYLGSEKSLVTLDMNEYQSDDSVDRIIGSSSNTNSIVNLVEKSPDLLIELTRIEKANISVKDLIQEILSQGKVNNSQGNPVDFSHCIIIITTCLGSNFIQEQLLIGVHLDEIEEELITTELNQALGVDLISSFNDIIVFNPLTPKDAIQITEGMIKKVEEMLNSKGILLKSRPEGIEILSHAGFDSNIGAKPLRKIIQEMVENKIAKKIIDGLIKTGDTVIIDINGEIMVEKGK
ncbi:MAG: AAA family ATPase [Candidatus Falkowbacteria bacterium]|nr:AAA family ATPase [Candidatus Falkowbacteria bacterium]